MRILLVNSFFSPYGGAEIIAYNTYKMMQEQQHETFFWASNKKPYFEDYKYQSHFAPYRRGIINYLRNPIKFYYNYSNKNILNKFIKETKPDLIHLHNIKIFTNSILECFKEIPTVMTVHDVNLICPAYTLLYKEKICNNYECQHGNNIHCILNNCYGTGLESSIRNVLRNNICKNNLKNINHFISPSNALKQKIIDAKIGINNEKISVINNFIPKNELNIKPKYSNQGYFLFTGRLSREKGVHYLLKAVKDLPKDIELHIVGKGPDEEKLKKYAKENSLDNVKFLGFKNKEEIKEEYQNCIATVLPCNWFENFPTTNMESFINGKPVIASNIGGIPEQVEHNKTGLLFEPTNVEQLKECILKYWNNPDLVIEHSKNAYEKAKTKYTEERYYNELINVYNQVIERNEQCYTKL